MCLRFVFLLITRTASWLRLSRREEVWRIAEILLLRHQLATLQRRASTVWEILKKAGIDPAPHRSGLAWSQFLRSQAEAILACDFLQLTCSMAPRLMSWP